MNITEISVNCRQDEFYRSSLESEPDTVTLYIVKSPVMFCINDEYIVKHKNSFVFIGPYTQYSIYASGEVLVFDRIIFIYEKKSNMSIHHAINLNTIYTISSSNKTDSIINMILNEYYKLGSHKKELLSRYTSSLFMLLASEIKTEFSTESLPYYEKLLEIRRNIHNKPSEKWTVDSICKQVNLSRSYFQLLYREAFGITCINDVIESKVRLACQLLESTQKTVSAIASVCGYDSDVHFMRQFKKITGLTPSEYRRKKTWT
jgi:AraC family transcriptional regulator of arabinose operon